MWQWKDSIYVFHIQNCNYTATREDRKHSPNADISLICDGAREASSGRLFKYQVCFSNFLSFHDSSIMCFLRLSRVLTPQLAHDKHLLAAHNNVNSNWVLRVEITIFPITCNRRRCAVVTLLQLIYYRSHRSRLIINQFFIINCDDDVKI